MLNSYSDKIFWQVGTRRFENKLKAYLYAKSQNIPLSNIQFHLFDHEFAHAKWDSEPSLSLGKLMAQRAKMLRERYDYIRIWYSGGVDSHTLLLCFLENNIPIEEIILYRCSPSNNFNDYANSEVNTVAVPFLESVKTSLIATKITFLDVGNREYHQTFKDNWIEKTNCWRFRPYTRDRFYELFPFLYSPFEKGVRHCDLIGKDKPRLLRRDGKFYSYFWDNTYTANVGEPFSEYFYVTPELPELHIKQSYMTKNLIKQKYPNLECIDGLFWKNQNIIVNEACRRPLWKPHTIDRAGEFDTPKALFAMEQAKQHDPSLLKEYMNSVEFYGLRNPEFYNEGYFKKDFLGIRTKEFCIGS
jgi:hypothetical protein